MGYDHSHPYLSIIIVTHNTWRLLRGCLHSLCNAPPPFPIEVLVVDNASTDGTANALADEFPEVIAIRNEQNLGFAAATNQGILRARAEHVLFLNSDTIVPSGSLGALVAFQEATHDSGIVGPALTDEHGQRYPSIRPFPTLTRVLLERVGIRRLLPWNRITDPYRRHWEVGHQPFQVDWVSGSCLLTRRSVFDRIGPLDERFFFYTEEVDFCLRAAQAGWRTYFLPTSSVIHLRGGATGQTEQTTYLVTLSANLSLLWFFRKHGGGIPLATLRAFLAADLAARMVRETLQGYGGSSKRRAYWEGFRACLCLRPDRITPGDMKVT